MVAKSAWALALVGVLSLGLGSAVSAQGSGDPVAERIGLMRSNGMVLRTAMRATGDDAADVARTLLGNFTALPALFEDPARPGDTLPAAWENSEAFIGLFAAAREASANALEAAEANDNEAYLTAIRAVNQTCSACHGTYRK